MKLKTIFKTILVGSLCVSNLMVISSCNSVNKNETSSNSPITSENVSKQPTSRMDEKIEADSMKSITKPVITGDFIQPWFCKDWDQSMWDEHLKMLKEAGINSVVIQGTSDLKEGKFSYLGFKTDLAKNKSLITDDLAYCPDSLGNLLEAAKTHGFKVFIGLSFDGDWWDGAKTKNPEYYKKWAEMEVKTLKEIYKNYYSTYKEQIEGFYWPWEMYTNSDKFEDHWVEMFNITRDALTSLNKDIPIMFAPYISAYYLITPEQHKTMWQNFYSKAHLNKGDIIMPQDSFGTSEKSLSYVEKHIQAIKSATVEDGRLSFWLDVENFDNSGEEEGQPAKIERFTRQLDIASKYADRLMCFSYAHYYNPTNGQEEFDQQYKKYLTTLK